MAVHECPAWANAVTHALLPLPETELIAAPSVAPVSLAEVPMCLTSIRRALPTHAVLTLALLAAGMASANTGYSNVFTLDLRRIAADSELTTLTRAVPIVLDVYGANNSHYTTELTLTNRGSTQAFLTYRYQPSMGDPAGSGAVGDTLAPGEQRTIPNALSYLRSLGLAIPSAATAGPQGGVLLVRFDGAESEEVVAATARTTTSTAAPQPAGAAGLSYAGVVPLSASEGSLTIYGLRDNSQDRANVAVFNPTSTAVTVRMTAFAGDASGYSTVVRDGLTIPGFGWAQATNVFSGTGIASGWVTAQRMSSSGRFGAYGVLNDNATNDGSFVLPTAGTISGSRLTVPVLVETSSFRSELVLANRSSSAATLTLGYIERLTPSLGSGGTTSVQLRPREQQVIPDAIEFLRRRGMAIGAMGAGSYAGALRISVSGTNLSDVFAGARTASPSPAGGQFGLFTPGVYESETAGDEAWVYGLRADTTSRSNLAVVHAGSASDGGVALEVQVYDGARGGAPAGSPRVLSLTPGQWEQITGILGGLAVQNGWVRVRRTAGTAPWFAYGVVNDGGSPGDRTGDGAYVPMTRRVPPAPLNLTGTFSGSNHDGAMSLTLRQTGEALSGYGTFALPYPYGSITVSVTGAVNGSTVTMAMQWNGGCYFKFPVVSITSATNDAIAGDYSAPLGCSGDFTGGSFLITRR